MNAAQKERVEERKFLSESVTPKSERQRNSWGSLLMSAQTVQGLCALDRKCVRKDGHDGACWPKEN